jgi:hypothetical protein
VKACICGGGKSCPVGFVCVGGLCRCPV